MDEREKRYVPVIVRFNEEGKLRPILIEFDESHKYPVDKVLDVRRAACQSVGGVGDRYTCLIQEKESYLWFEKGRWFVCAIRPQIPGLLPHRPGQGMAVRPHPCGEH